MKDIIVSKLKELETKNFIKILYACEAGSRAWGLQSEDSDYDVRFIYIHHPSFYLSIDPVGIGKKKDVLDIPIHNSIDMHGFELTKALRLFRKSNPNLLEWVHSEIIYYKAFQAIEKMLEVESNIFQVTSCIHHYINMAKRNFHIIKERNEMDVKRYIHVIRPILISKWIYAYQSFPPMQITTLINEMTERGAEQAEIFLLIDAKKKQQDFTSDYLQSFVKRELVILEQSIREITREPLPPITDKLDEIFRNTLIECWP